MAVSKREWTNINVDFLVSMLIDEEQLVAIFTEWNLLQQACNFDQSDQTEFGGIYLESFRRKRKV